jgi:hypothetical protein
MNELKGKHLLHTSTTTIAYKAVDLVLLALNRVFCMSESGGHHLAGSLVRKKGNTEYWGHRPLLYICWCHPTVLLSGLWRSLVGLVMLHLTSSL